MSEQEMLISLVCHGNLKALRQTKNLNLKGVDKLVYVFITILKEILALAWSYCRLLMNWLMLCRVFEIRLFNGSASFHHQNSSNQNNHSYNQMKT